MGWLNEIYAFRKLRHCGHSKIPPGNSWRPLTVPLSGPRVFGAYHLQKTVTRVCRLRTLGSFWRPSRTLGFRSLSCGVYTVIRRATRFPFPAHPAPHGTRVGFTASIPLWALCKHVLPTPKGPPLHRSSKLQYPLPLPSIPPQPFRRSIRSVGFVPIFGPCHDSGVKRALAVDGALIPTTNLTAIPP